MTEFNIVTYEIIKAQQAVIGPLALEQAKTVMGIHFINADEIELSGDPMKILEDLVKKYAEFFGQASIEVCKDAVREIKPPISSEALPDILK